VRLRPGKRKPVTKLLWQAQHEGGDYSEWDLGGFGGHQDDTVPSTLDNTRAHSGRWSLKMPCDTTSGQNGTRNFRWAVDQAGNPVPNPGIYTCWYFWDTIVTPGTFWSIMQWKTKAFPSGSNPNFSIDVWHGPGGMGLYVFDYNLSTDHSANGFSADGSLPINTWHRLDVDYQWDTTANGHVRASLNGAQFFSIDQVVTEFVTTATPNVRHWSINSYASNNTPNATNLWADDVSISDPQYRKSGSWHTRSGGKKR
jgi:hypothetical protein